MAHAKSFETFTPSVEEVLYYLKQWAEDDNMVQNKRKLDRLFLTAKNPFSGAGVIFRG